MNHDSHPFIGLGRQRRQELLQDARACLTNKEPLPSHRDYAMRWEIETPDAARVIRRTRQLGLLTTERRAGRNYVVRVG